MNGMITQFNYKGEWLTMQEIRKDLESCLSDSDDVIQIYLTNFIEVARVRYLIEKD